MILKICFLDHMIFVLLFSISALWTVFAASGQYQITQGYLYDSWVQHSILIQPSKGSCLDIVIQYKDMPSMNI